MDGELVKVVFTFDRQGDGWPPVAAESVWAVRLGATNRYRLDNVPWFARGVAYGDIVGAEPDDQGVLHVLGPVEWSGRYTIRVIPRRDGPAEDETQAIVEAFSALGAECESAHPAFRIVALDIPPTAQLAAIKRRLVDGEAAGRWGYEEGCVDGRWTAL